MPAISRTVWMWCLASLISLGSAYGEDARIEYFPVPSEHEKELQLRLDQPVGAQFDDTALNEALNSLMAEETSGDSWLIIDQQALNDEGIDVATPSSLHLDGVSRRSALRLLLEPHGLVAMVEGDVLRVTTRTVASLRLKVRVYPVGDLAPTPEELGQLVETVREAVDPDAWDAEIPRRTISFVPKSRSLVIRQTAESHETVLELLRSLRQSLAEDQAQNPPAE